MGIHFRDLKRWIFFFYFYKQLKLRNSIVHNSEYLKTAISIISVVVRIVKYYFCFRIYTCIFIFGYFLHRILTVAKMVIAHKIERFLHSIKSRLKNLWKPKQNVLIGQLHFGTFRSIPELIGICVLGSKCFSSFFYSSSFVSIRFTMRFIHRIVDILVSWCVNGTNNHCLATTICDQWGKNAACSVYTRSCSIHCCQWGAHV